MTIAVVTIAHGRHRHLRNQIRGLACSACRPDIHIIVAMDDPAVGDIVVEQCSPATVLPLAAARPLPLAHARNVGAAAALQSGAQLLIFLDVDCIPSPQLTGRYAAAADHPNHAGAVLCGPVTYLRPAGPHGYDIDQLDSTINPHPGRPAPSDDQIIATTDYHLFWSLSFGLQAATWRAIGGFCERYRGYGGEDTDFAQSARAHNIPLRWVGGAHAFHQHHPVQDPPIEHLDDILRNAIIFHRRWGFWPMPGWLNAFESRGLIRRAADGTPVRLTARTADKES